jgi:hypothetical protein
MQIARQQQSFIEGERRKSESRKKMKTRKSEGKEEHHKRNVGSA